MQRFSARSSGIGKMCRVRRRIAACRRHRLFEGGDTDLERHQVAGGCFCCGLQGEKETTGTAG